MRSTSSRVIALTCVGLLLPLRASAQINFTKSGYYLSLGDSVAAGEGALPVTHGFVYQLYDRGVFGRTQVMDFSNVAIKGATAAEVLALQVPEALCILPPRIGLAPSVITLTAGANDFFVYLASNGIPADPLTEIPLVADAIAENVANIIRSLIFGVSALPSYCARAGLPGIKVLAFNYYGFDHPDPQINFVLNLALRAFSTGLRARIAQIRDDIRAAGGTAQVGFVDTFDAFEGRSGLLLVQKQHGFTGAFEFEIHPTNAGHTVIAREFENAWRSLQ